MEKQTRLKKFNGLPHSLSGLDYTYDAEVEGGEVSYTPKNSKNEFIFRKKSSNIKELEKQDKLRKNRPEGDRISDISFDAIAKELMLDESQQLASEGIDPFNGGKEVFATGGMYEPDPMGEIPQIVDNPPKESTGMSAGDATGYMATIGNLASSFGQFGENDPYAEVTPQRDPVNQVTEQTVGSVVGAIPIVGQAYSGGQGLATFSEAGIADMRAKDNDAGAQAAALGKGFSSPSGSYFDLAEQNRIGAINDSQHASAIGLNLMFPGLGDALVGEPANKKFAESQQKQADYNATLTERGKIPQSNEVVRNRTQEFKNGGMKKKYAGDNGSVRRIGEEDFWNPSEADMMAGNMSYIPYGGIPQDFQIPTEQLGVPQLPTKPYSGVDEPIDADTPYVPKRDMNNPVLYPEIGEYTTGSTEIPASNKNKFKFDPNMLASIAGGLGQIAPSIAYLAGDGKDYDRVKYPTYNPDRVTADLPLRETRDAFASARDAMKQQGKLDLGALSALATQEAKGRSGVRENVRNVNTGMMNDAQLKNIATTIQAMNDEAANKGQYQTNKYEAMKDISKGAALGARQYNMMSNDEIRKQLIASMVDQKFEELYPS